MKIRSVAVLRSAKEIGFVKQSHNAIQPIEYEHRLISLLYKNRSIFIGFVGEWKAGSTKFAFMCRRGHIEVKNISGAMAGRGCKKCAIIDVAKKRKLPMTEIMARINKEIANRNNTCEFVKFDGGYIKNTVRNLVMRCVTHDTEFVTSYAEFIIGAGGRCCQKDTLRNLKKLSNHDVFMILTDIAKKRGGCDVVGIDGEYRNNETKNIIINCHAHGEYKTSLVAFKERNSCPKCTRNKKRPEEIAMAELMAELDKKPHIKFVRFDGGYRGVMLRNLVLCCEYHGEWVTCMRDVMKGRGCSYCAGNRKTEEMAIEEVKNIVRKRGDCEFVCFDGGYIGCYEMNLIIRCNIHGEYRTSHTLFVGHEQGCSSCAKYGYRIDKPGYVYIQKISGVVDACKIGISNRKPSKRMTDQKRQSKLNHELVFQYRFEDGRKARDIENMVKESLKHMRGVVPRELMKDGYTETLPPDVLPTLLNEVKSLCKALS